MKIISSMTFAKYVTTNRCFSQIGVSYGEVGLSIPTFYNVLQHFHGFFAKDNLCVFSSRKDVFGKIATEFTMQMNFLTADKSALLNRQF
jgi:hypothetical protein